MLSENLLLWTVAGVAATLAGLRYWRLWWSCARQGIVGTAPTNHVMVRSPKDYRGHRHRLLGIVSRHPTWERLLEPKKYRRSIAKLIAIWIWLGYLMLWKMRIRLIALLFKHPLLIYIYVWYKLYKNCIHDTSEEHLISYLYFQYVTTYTENIVSCLTQDPVYRAGCAHPRPQCEHAHYQSCPSPSPLAIPATPATDVRSQECSARTRPQRPAQCVWLWEEAWKRDAVLSFRLRFNFLVCDVLFALIVWELLFELMVCDLLIYYIHYYNMNYYYHY